MKTKLTLLMLLAFPISAMAIDDTVQNIPEPSILGLFAAAAIGFTAIQKFKK